MCLGYSRKYKNMFTNYKIKPDWDTSLDIVGTLPDGLVIVAVKETTGAPTAISNRYAPSALVLNNFDGTQYRMSGSSASPSFELIESGTTPQSVQSVAGTIATTGATSTYIIAPQTGTLSSIDFSGTTALATNNTNFVTFTATNLGQAGSGSTVLLASTDANTTKTTGSAITANAKRSLTLTSTGANLSVTAGDRIVITATATGTLANTVTFATYLARFV